MKKVFITSGPYLRMYRFHIHLEVVMKQLLVYNTNTTNLVYVDLSNENSKALFNWGDLLNRIIRLNF